MSVNDGWNSVVVDMSMAVLDDFYSCDPYIMSAKTRFYRCHGQLAFLLGLVCQHGTESDITNTLDTFCTGVELIVNDDSSLFIRLDADLVKSQTFSNGSTTDRDENDICFNLNESASEPLKSAKAHQLLFTALCRVHFELDDLSLSYSTNDFGVELEFEALFL